MNTLAMPRTNAQDQVWMLDGRADDALDAARRKQMFGRLTGKQQAWLTAYLSNGFNATEAARQAGYQATERRTHSTIGYRNRHHPVIARLIADAFQERVMEAGEALARVAAIARGSMGDFVAVDSQGHARVDLGRAAESGAMALIKQLDIDEDEYTDGEGHVHTRVRTRIRLHDPLKALDMVLKATGAYQPLEDDASTVNNFFGAINQQLVQSASSPAS